MTWLKSRNWSNIVLWSIYLALLGVLLPHTAWAFSMFEPERWAWLGWVAAIAFEGAIAAFTWKLKQNIEQTGTFGRVWSDLRRVWYIFDPPTGLYDRVRCHPAGLLTPVCSYPSRHSG